jgi:hypothetical protein
MSQGRWVPPQVVGESRFTSRLFSNRWSLIHRGTTVAELLRDPLRHTSMVVLPDGIRIDLTPSGWGTIEATVGDEALARIDRRSWWGRRWQIEGLGFSCDLTSDPAPRRWTFRIGGEPVGHLAGTLWSYNRLRVQSDVVMPVHALALAWHVLARPWEQAAAPRTLVPDAGPAA